MRITQACGPGRFLWVLLASSSLHAAAVADPQHSVFAPPLAAYAASDTVQRARADAASCLPTFAALEARYRTLEQVFVLDFSSLAQPEGPGSVFRRQLHLLTEASLAGRALFVQRNAPGACSAADASLCRFDPSRYLGGEGGFSWRWSSRAQRAVGAAMTRLGASESHLYVDPKRAGYVFPDDGARVDGEVSFAALLASPHVATRPWVTLHFAHPPHSGPSATVWGSDQANEPWQAVLGHEQPQNYTKCHAAAFSAPSRALQAKLLPFLRRADAARAAGGAMVGLHVRTLYADFAADMPWSREALDAAAAKPQPTPRGVMGWTQLDCMFPDCEPAMDAADVAAAVDARPPIWQRPPVEVAPTCGGVPRTPLCHYWDAESKVALDSGGRACGTPGRGAPLLGLGEDPRGLMSATVSCALAEAESRSAEPAASLLYVAGDLPALHALVAAHPQLRNRSVFAEGAVGHASSNALCSSARACVRGADPGGSWGRTMVDWYMLGACDALVRTGTSTFVTGFVATRMLQPQPQRELAGAAWHPKHIQEQARLLYRLSNAIVDGMDARRKG